MKLVTFIAAFLLPFAAWATPPTLGANGSTSVNATSGVVALAIGSPAASDLDVLEFACNDASSADTLAIVTPSGWTKEIERTGTFETQGVLWKIAGGSEGATLNVTVGTGTSECASWYFKFTGYAVANPIDCTDIAWTTDFLSTFDPPNQSVAGGPLDVYYTAFATSRGDEVYVSGSDLTTNAHLNGTDFATGRSVAVSYGSYTASSSKNPGAFVIGSNGRTGSALTCVIYPTAAAGGINRPLLGPLGGPLSRGPT